jgi:hypothetical protein
MNTLNLEPLVIKANLTFDLTERLLLAKTIGNYVSINTMRTVKLKYDLSNNSTNEDT